ASSSRRVDMALPSLRTQRSRKFVAARDYLDSVALHPQGDAMALTTRGKAFSFGNWEGPVIQHGTPDGVRYRLLEWLNDGKRLVAVGDEIGREALVVFQPEDASEPKVYADIEFGRADILVVSPTDDMVAITNHRLELLVVDLAAITTRVLDRSHSERMAAPACAPDDRWCASEF